MGNRLREVRRAAGLGQAAVASRLGVTTATVSRYERGHIELSQKQAQLLADLFGVPVSALFDDEAASPIAGMGRVFPLFEIEGGKLVATSEAVRDDYAGSETSYSVVVPDDAMTSRLAAGDVLIVDPAVEPTPGCIVVAEVDDEVVIRRYTPLHKSDPRAPGFVLSATNAGWPDIVVADGYPGRVLAVARVRREVL